TFRQGRICGAGLPGAEMPSLRRSSIEGRKDNERPSLWLAWDIGCKVDFVLGIKRHRRALAGSIVRRISGVAIYRISGSKPFTIRICLTAMWQGKSGSGT